MGLALIEAAAQAGLRITLLDTCYLRGGLAADGSPVALSGVQERFGDGDGARWAERASELGADEHGMLGAHARAGVAIHSVRAVPPDQMQPVAAWSHAYGAPLHAHLSEQPAENVACLAAYGVTPARLLDQAGALGPRSTVVHATHLTSGDIGLLGGSRTVACFCPTTEADLADGIGPARALADAGCPLSLGSDSHAVVDLLGGGAAGGDGGAAGGWQARVVPRPGTGRRGDRGRARLPRLARGRRDRARRDRGPGDRGAGHPAAGRHPAWQCPGVGDLRRLRCRRPQRGDQRPGCGGRGRHLLVDGVPAALDAAIAPLLSPA